MGDNNRRQGQGFIGIGSGVTGDTVIVTPVWTPVAGTGGRTGRRKASELHLRLAPGWEVEEDVLGTAEAITTWVVRSCAVLLDGTSVRMPDTITNTDAAMQILQYLADALDPRLCLEFYALAGKQE